MNCICGVQMRVLSITTSGGKDFYGKKRPTEIIRVWECPDCGRREERVEQHEHNN